MVASCSVCRVWHRTDAPPAREVRELSRRSVHPSRVEYGAMTDAELGTLARAGQVQAVAGLLERHRPSLYAAAIRLLGNRADALDAVQDACVVALVRLPGLRDPAAAKPWLHTVL